MAFAGLPCREMKGFLSFRLADEFLPENSGIYVLSAKEGRIYAVKSVSYTHLDVYKRQHVKNDGHYVKKDNSAGDNLTILDKQVGNNTTNITNLGNTINKDVYKRQVLYGKD